MCEVDQEVVDLVRMIKAHKRTMEKNNPESQQVRDSFQYVLRELQAELADLVCNTVEQ